MRERLLVAWATVWCGLTWPRDAGARWAERRAVARYREAVLRLRVTDLEGTVVALAGRLAVLEVPPVDATEAWAVASTRHLLERVGRLEIDRSALRRDVREVARLARELPAQRVRLHEAEVHGLAAAKPATTTADGVAIREGS